MTATAQKIVETFKTLSDEEQDMILNALISSMQRTGPIPDEVSDHLAEELFLQMDQDEMNNGKN